MQRETSIRSALARRLLCALVAGVSWAAVSPARAAIKTEPVEYKQGDAVLHGFLAYDDAVQGKRPGVLVVHEWWGNNEYSHRRAEQLAALGYVAFAADMYGNGQTASTPDEAKALAGPLQKDRALMRARAAAGLEVLRANPMCEPKKIAAIGYCFGGTTVLELARSGADVSGVVSFHGGLATPTPATDAIKCKVLVASGADDPNVPPEQVKAFDDEMRAAGADYQVILYGGAVHAFTNPNADSHHMKGIGYNEKADRRSWQAMKDFFNELFGTTPASPTPDTGRKADAGQPKGRA